MCLTLDAKIFLCRVVHGCLACLALGRSMLGASRVHLSGGFVRLRVLEAADIVGGQLFAVAIAIPIP